jgi:hypothetical protein
LEPPVLCKFKSQGDSKVNAVYNYFALGLQSFVALHPSPGSYTAGPKLNFVLSNDTNDAFILYMEFKLEYVCVDHAFTEFNFFHTAS